MKKTNQKTILMELIIATQKQKTQDLQQLKNQYQTTINSFSTLNIIKATLQEIVATPNLTSNIIHSTLELGSQYLSTTFFNLNSTKANSWLGKMVGFLLKKPNYFKKKSVQK